MLVSGSVSLLFLEVNSPISVSLLFFIPCCRVPQFQATDATSTGTNDHAGLEGVGEVGDATLEPEENTGDFGWERQRVKINGWQRTMNYRLYNPSFFLVSWKDVKLNFGRATSLPTKTVDRPAGPGGVTQDVAEEEVKHDNQVCLADEMWRAFWDNQAAFGWKGFTEVLPCFFNGEKPNWGYKNSAERRLQFFFLAGCTGSSLPECKYVDNP